MTGPNQPALLALIQETIDAFPFGPPESHFDFVPDEIWEEVEAATQHCRELFRAIVEAAQGLHRYAPGAQSSDDLFAPYRAMGRVAEISPVETAIRGLANLSVNSVTERALDEIAQAIVVLSKQDLEPKEQSKPGRRRIGGLGEALARACYYHRYSNDVSVALDWTYGGPIPIPKTPTATLACAVVEIYVPKDGPAQIKTHLDKFTEQLRKAGKRAPQRSDFIAEFY